MPRKNLDEHFENDRPEWTKRKHKLLGRIVKPSAEKMKKIRGRLALVDGYAGPNEYGGTVLGSTAILAEAAQVLKSKGFPAQVFACEERPKRFEQLAVNLGAYIESGLLTAYQSSHASALPDILEKIKGWPAIVFLDPHGPSDLRLEADLIPWLIRPKTDVLGVFMGMAAARVCAEAAGLSASPKSRQTASAILGSEWAEATTEATAYGTFLRAISGRKKFTGIYPLRKQETQHRAYAVFGASDSVHGFQLLSDAIAYDWGALKDYDFKRKETTLFSELEREDEQRRDFDRLVELVRPLLRAC